MPGDWNTMGKMRIGVIGSGATATALVRGWREPVLCAAADPARAAELAAEAGGEALTDYAAVARDSDVVVLCHEPAQLTAIARTVAPYAPIVVSTLAETPLEVVRNAYPNRPVYRAAASPPCEVRHGVTVFATAAPQATDDQVHALFARVGKVIVLDDELVDIATAVVSDVLANFTLALEAQQVQARAHPRPRGRRRVRVGRGHDHRRAADS
jgi:pyrroline-5-carboxylate reductase